ncbi:UNVERIFIED_CONTAM: Reticulon-like protein B21 [Sesamum latifolium]|uniref:Reticulon-like protein n=1 Tax=Sesamum latifolium TaxID=2727402 RepID=A0AAW2XBM5_9LAMI
MDLGGSRRSGRSSTMKNSEVQVAEKVNNMRPKQSPGGVNGKTKTRKSESVESSQVQISRQRSELSRNWDEKRKELSGCCDGIKRSPVQIKKTRTVSSPAQKGAADPISDGNEMSLVQLRKVKSDSSDALVDSKSYGSLRKVKSETGNSLALQLVRAKTVVARTVSDERIEINRDDADVVVVSRESNNDLGGTEKSPVGIGESRSDEDCKVLSVCEEEATTGNVDPTVGAPPDVDYVDVDGEEREEVDKGIEVENECLDVKEININVDEQKPVIEEKKSVHSNEKPVPISPIVKKQTHPALNHARTQPTPTRTNPIDLIMWRDVSKSAFIFGIGAFLIISSSYSNDINISIVSVLSYIGLVYLAAVFLFKSLITRGGSADVDETEEECVVVGEEEAVWVVRVVLPYVNEFLVKLRALFSGDPATTIKLAVILFILARCGGSITIWKMAKLGFFGVFTVPKVCSSYSAQLTAYVVIDSGKQTSATVSYGSIPLEHGTPGR